jgi:nucleotide-binding universal stress UspA family protein
MDIREVLIVLRPDRPNDAVLAAASAVALDHRAYARGLCLYSAPPPSLAECYVIGAAGVNEVVDHLGQEVDRLLAPVRDAFRASLDAGGIDGDWTALQGIDVAAAPLRARLCDLVILSRPRAHDPESMGIATSFLIDGGTPCLLVPDGAGRERRFKRIAIAWNGTREAKRAMEDAMPFLRHADAVELVIVGDPPQTHMHDRSDAPEVHLARHGVAAEATHLPRDGDVAQSILERCQAFGADLLVMGTYGHAPLAEAVLGGVTRSILRHAPISVFMAR